MPSHDINLTQPATFSDRIINRQQADETQIILEKFIRIEKTKNAESTRRIPRIAKEINFTNPQPHDTVTLVFDAVLRMPNELKYNEIPTIKQFSRAIKFESAVCIEHVDLMLDGISSATKSLELQPDVESVLSCKIKLGWKTQEDDFELINLIISELRKQHSETSSASFNLNKNPTLQPVVTSISNTNRFYKSLQLNNNAILNPNDCLNRRKSI